MSLEALISKEGKRSGKDQMTAVGVEEFAHLRTLVGDMLEIGVDVVDEENGFDGRLIAAQGLKRVDGARTFVIENLKFLLLKTGNGRTGFGGHHDIEEYPIIRGSRLRIGGHIDFRINRGTAGILGEERKIARQEYGE